MPTIATLTALLISFVATGAFAQSAKDVNVTNFPNPQNVAGSVEVSNLPAVQDVNVTNDTANPVEVAGAVEVTNLPAPGGAARFQLVGFTS
jgi:hypothetical protein